MTYKKYRLEDICEFIKNGKSVQQTKDQKGLPITRIETIANSVIDPAKVGYANLALEGNESYLLKNGDILFSHINSVEHLFKTAKYDGVPEQLIHGMNLLCLRPNVKLIDPQFFLHLLRSDNVKRGLLTYANKSVNQASISATSVKNFEVDILSLEEQRRIALILDKADGIRQKRQQAISKLDELLQATFIDMFGDPVSNPKGWEFKSLKEFGTFKNGLNYEKGESGVTRKYIGVGNFKNFSKLDDIDSLGSIELNQDPSQDYFLKDGDLLFVRSNGNKELVGRCIAVYPKSELVTYSGFCIRYRIEKQGLTPEFISHLFRSESFRSSILKAGQGANIQNINQQSLGELKIPVPSEDLLVKWSKILNQVERQKTLYWTELEHSLFSSLQQKAFNGTI